VPETITIRIASLDEFERIRDVRVETLHHHVERIPERFQETDDPPPTREFIANILAENHGALLIAEFDDAVVAFLTVRISTPDASYLVPDVCGTVDTLGVKEEWRGQGVGRMLMDAAHEWAAAKGVTRMYLNVWEANTNALAFYEALGYATANRTLWKSL